jgi:hypothetical protein
VSIRYIGKVGETFLSTATTTNTVTPTISTTVGQYLVLAVRLGSGFGITSVTDTVGNAWSKIGESGLTQTVCSLWSCSVSSALSTSDTITVTKSGSTGNGNVAVWAFGGINRPVTTSVNNRSGTTGTTLAVGDVIPSQYASLMFTTVATNATATFTQPSGFTSLPVTTSSVYLSAAYLIQPSTATQSTTWTFSSVGNCGGVSASLTPDGGDFFAVM